MKLNLANFNKTDNYLYRNIQVRSRKHCCSEKAVSIMYYILRISLYVR
jgi:hypothetical protein